MAALAQARATDAGTLVVVLPHAAGADPAEAELLAVVMALTATDGVRHRGGIVDQFAADWDRLIRRGLFESLAGRFETVQLSHWSWPEMRAASVVLTASCVGRRAGGAEPRSSIITNTSTAAAAAATAGRWALPFRWRGGGRRLCPHRPPPAVFR